MFLKHVPSILLNITNLFVFCLYEKTNARVKLFIMETRAPIGEENCTDQFSLTITLGTKQGIQNK